MPIQISTTQTQIAIDIKHPDMRMSGNGQKPLDIDMDQAKIEMTTDMPQIQIDQSECFAECGLKDISAFMADSVSYVKQKYQEGVARIVDDGNQMAAIETKVDPIPDMSYRNAYDMFDHEFNYDAIPKSRPQIQLIRGKVNYQYTKAKVTNRSQQKPVQITYTKGQATVRVKQYGSVKINYDSSSLYYHI